MIEKSQSPAKGENIFDINTAIEVCRQQPDTMEHAEKLAEYSKNYKLLVQIKIENRRDNYGALDIIDRKIKNIKEKVTCLQLYVPKLLKLRGSGKEDIEELRDKQQRILKIVTDIASALCEWVKLNKRGFETADYKQQFELK